MRYDNERPSPTFERMMLQAGNPQWVPDDPSDYDLEEIAETVERSADIMLESETGLHVQVLRLTPASFARQAVEVRIEKAAETWTRAFAVSTSQYVYLTLYSEE